MLCEIHIILCKYDSKDIACSSFFVVQCVLIIRIYFHIFSSLSISFECTKKNNTKHIFGSLTPFNIKVLLQLRMKIYHFEYILTWILGQYISSLSFFLSFVPFCCVAEKMRHSSLSFLFGHIFALFFLSVWNTLMLFFCVSSIWRPFFSTYVPNQSGIHITNNWFKV